MAILAGPVLRSLPHASEPADEHVHEAHEEVYEGHQQVEQDPEYLHHDIRDAIYGADYAADSRGQ